MRPIRLMSVAFTALLLWSPTVAQCPDCASFTDLETDLNGNPFIAYETGDSIAGCVGSNGAIGIAGSPIFFGPVITHAPDFYHGPDYDPDFRDTVVFNARVTELPATAEALRQEATASGFFYERTNRTYYMRFVGLSVDMWRWNTGTPMDSSERWGIPLSFYPGTCIFVDDPVWIEGRVEGRVTIGSSQTIRIINSIHYVDCNWPYGSPSFPDPHSRNMLGIVSESDVKVGNTWRNGRENSGGRGRDQTNRDSADVVITAMVVALGGCFTFENQNDPDSGYVCDCIPDYRGTIYLYGSLWQRRRGYFHRHNNEFTGYDCDFRYDRRLSLVRPPGLFDIVIPPQWTHVLDFGDVPFGASVWDTAYVEYPYWATLGLVWADYPFYAVRFPPYDTVVFRIPTRFTPPGIGSYHGTLHVTIESDNFEVALLGWGVPPSDAREPSVTLPSTLRLSVQPNPFNSTTTLIYHLPSLGSVRISVVDISGRIVRDQTLKSLPAGEHRFTLDGSHLTSGVYLLRLTTSSGTATAKLLLLK